MRKICPTCKRNYTELENYCTKCGKELVKEPNRCSENKTALCKTKTFADDDVYCSFCGSPTMYWKDHLEDIKNW